MAITLADAVVMVGADYINLRRDLGGAEKQTQSWAKSFTSNLAANLGAGLTRAIGGALRNITRGLANLTREMVTGNAQFETYENRFAVLLRSVDLAKQRMQELERFGATTPFELPGVVQADVILQSFGFHAEETAARYGRSGEEIRRIAGDVASGVGAKMEEMAGFIGRFSAGSTGEAIQRFQELGVTTRREMEQMGLEFSKAGQLITPVDEAMTVLLDIMDNKFGGMMERQSATFDGMLSNLQDWAANAKRFLGEPIFDFLKIELRNFLALLETPRFQQALTIIRNLFAAAFGGIAAIVKAGLAIASQVFTGWMQGTDRDMEGMANNSFEWGKNVVVQLARGMAAAISAVLTVIKFISGLMASWFAPGSPPKIAKDIDKWGTSMINEWLGGMLKGDWQIFDTIAGTVENMIRSSVSGAPEEGVVSRVLGSRQAIRDAMLQVVEVGRVTDEIFNQLQERIGGDLSPVMAGYLRNQLELQVATRELAEAQRELNDINREYDAILEPLQDRLREISRAEADLRDEKRSARLREIIADSRTGDSERQAAMLELERLGIQQNIRATEAERDAATEGAEEKATAAEERQRQLQDEIAAQEGMLRFQEQNNRLLSEMAGLAETAAGAMAGLGGAMAGLGAGGAGGFGLPTVEDLLPDAEELGGMIQEIIDEIMPLFDGMDEQALAIGQDFATITEGLEREAPLWITTLEGLITAWQGNAEQMSIINDTVDRSWGGMGTNIGLTIAALRDRMRQDWRTIGSDTLGTIHNLRLGAMVLWSYMRNDITTFLAVKKIIWQRGWDAAEERLRKFRQRATAFLTGVRKDLTKWFRARTDQVAEWIDGVKTLFSLAGWEGIGTSIMEGIGTGITTAATALAGTIGGIVTGLIDAAKAAAGIESPSKVAAAEIGVPISEGIGQGLLAGLKNIRPEIQRATAGMLSDMAGDMISPAGISPIADALIKVAAGLSGGNIGSETFNQDVKIITGDNTDQALGAVRRDNRRRRIGIA